MTAKVLNLFNILGLINLCPKKTRKPHKKTGRISELSGNGVDALK